MEPQVLVWRDVVLPRSETFIANQAAHLVRYRPAICGLQRLEDGLPVPVAHTVPDRAVSGRVLRRAARHGIAVGGLRSALNRSHVVHAHFLPDAMTVLPLARRAGKPLAVTVHGYDATTSPLVEDPRYLAGIERLVRYGTLFMPVSRFLADRLGSIGVPDEQIRQRYIGVVIPEDEFMLTDRTGVLFVGRLVEKKGALDLLEAMSDPRLRGYRLTVVGDGPLRGALEAAASARRLDVHFAGVLPPDGVAAAMSEAAVLCVPSRRSAEGDAEGFGMVFAEAAAQRLPSVSYRHGGIPEAVNDEVTGLLAPEGDVRGLADRLHRLMSDPEAVQRFGDAARARAIREFNVATLTRRVEDVYDEVIAGRADHRSSS